MNGTFQRKAIVIGVIGLLLTMLGVSLSTTYRLARKERILSEFSVALQPGKNKLFLRLPQGRYLCAAAYSPLMRKQSLDSADDIERPGVVISIRGSDVDVETSRDRTIF